MRLSDATTAGATRPSCPGSARAWWTTRGLFAQSGRELETEVLDACTATGGRRLLHVFDRGFAGSPWIGLCLERTLRFLLRWRHPTTSCAMGRATRARPGRLPVGNARGPNDRGGMDGVNSGSKRACWRWSEYEQPLWLIVSRPGKGQPPWYVLTTEPISTQADAWTIVFAYARSFQIEMALRFQKSELGCESPRLWRGPARLKLLLLVSLVSAFLLTLLDQATEGLRTWLLR